MQRESTYVLVHSPLVGDLTWSLVAARMRHRDIAAIVPLLDDAPGSNEPSWKQHTGSVSAALAKLSPNRSIILVAHSGAGPLLPAIREGLENPVHAYVFVDADPPRNGATRLDLMRSEDPEWAAQFQKELEQGGRFPTWSFEDLREVIPDERLRRQMVAELRPRALSFFTEPIPVFAAWPDAPCIYIQFSAPYESSAAHARRAGWPTYRLEAGHFHMLVDPAAVTDLVLQAVKGLD